ncbi:hypothetical protein SLEP1_g24591 [Rubroshorea leprosula]|uniref:Uncharacterized protein n=1 Tax=Rubroshorea leprosula TaxID=152421 RepID=A0AAV5JG63_9ROSI|nr:hypothetical protein SLEP1_g24591 [Rubroshorea leprosula]
MKLAFWFCFCTEMKLAFWFCFCRDKGLEAADGGHEQAAGSPFLAEIRGGSCGVADG